MNLIMRLMALCAILSLSGCSYLSNPTLPGSYKFQNRDKHYLNAQSIPPLRIPPGLDSDAFHNQYPISAKSYPAELLYTDLQPPGLYR